MAIYVKKIRGILSLFSCQRAILKGLPQLMSLQLNQKLTAIVKGQYMHVSDILSSVPKKIKSEESKCKKKKIIILYEQFFLKK